ncbi:MAG: AsmA-like C-terminal domain-containing protein, partial [Hyphomonas sp.]
TFEMFRPPLNDVPYEDVRFTAIGTVRDAGLRGAALGFDLTGSRMAVAVDQAGAEITGDGQLGPSPVGFRWYQGFMDDGAPADLTANGTVTADFLNRFGILGRAYMTGEAPIDVRAKLAGADLISSYVKADLTSARLDMSELGWVKPAGDPASAEVDYRAMDERSTSSVNFRSSTARVDGDFTLGSDSRLLAATLREAYLRNMADVSGSISRERDESLTVTLAGKYLDISGIMPGLGAMSDEAEEDGVPLSIAASVDRLSLRPGLDLRNAKLMANSDSIGFHTLQASGLTAGGAAMEARFDASGEGPPRLNVVSDDAGFIASAVLGADFLTGGRLVMSGTMEKDGEPANIDLQITNARMREAPFLTQILSLASLRGLTDTLGGEGVMFSRIDIPLKVSDGRYVITGAKAQGPALGLTASGYINTRTAELEVDGVLVPSFGVNSALGGIPVIGDLVVGRDGEGIFSLTYSVRGTLERANVAVNPLSALAPGVIRRIFENPSDTRIPEAVPRPPDAPIPDELPPIPEETF